MSDITEVQFTELRGKSVNSHFKILLFFCFFTNITNVHPLVEYCHPVMLFMYKPSLKNYYL